MENERSLENHTNSQMCFVSRIRNNHWPDGELKIEDGSLASAVSVLFSILDLPSSPQ